MRYKRKYMGCSNFSKWENIAKQIIPSENNLLGKVMVLGGLGGLGWGASYTGYKYVRGETKLKDIPEELIANSLGGIGAAGVTVVGSGLLNKLNKLT